jgi:glycosyltransferase involved in cell wall biosynthesis
VVPVYNHGDRVEAVVREILTLGGPVIVVDDGSSDRSPAVLAKIPGIRLLRHAVNRGKGAALISGMRAAARVADWAVTIDADGQHRPRDAFRLMAAITPPRRPIVVGLRRGMGRAPWTSRFGRGFSNFWVRRAGGPALGDTQSGLRAYPLPETLALPVRARRYQYEIEVLVSARWQGMEVLETPVGVVYADGSQRVSHFRPVADFMRNSGTFARLITRRVFTPRLWRPGGRP